MKEGSDYCSKKCKNGLSKNQKIKNCKNCDSKIITTPSVNKKFCDKECFREYQKQEKNIEKECPNCGKVFTVPKSVDSKYCDKECMSEAYSDGRYKKENHHNWKGGKIEKTCVECGENFEVWPKREHAQYCSTDCMSEGYTGKWVGEDNPSYERIETECSWCGKTLMKIPYFIHNHDNHFCDVNCQGKWVSQNNSGEDHPNWKGGHPEYYGENWIRQRQKALERDDFKCVICGKDESELGKNPSVHHLKPIRDFDEPEKANDLDNLICLCESHHSLVEGWNLAPANILEN